MIKFKQKLIYIVWLLMIAILVFISSKSYHSVSSILAQVEPQKYAISFHKAVKIKEIYVIPGQQIKKGDSLIKVERQDLLLDVDRKSNELKNLQNQLETTEVESNYQLKLAKVNYDLDMANVASDIDRLNMMQTQQAQLNASFSQLNIRPTTIQDSALIDTRIDHLASKKISLGRAYALKKVQIAELKELKISALSVKIEQAQDELKILKKEESELVKIATVDAVVGNIFVETDELVSPFSTLISIYDHNPSVIRAIVDEHQSIDVVTGQKVMVESTNRSYHVEGIITEIGSRIIAYPNRLKANQEIQTYGREIFISIPSKSNFLHGEKVYVKI